MFQARTPNALAAEISGLLEMELAEHRMNFEATAAMLDHPLKETLNLLESAILSRG